MQVTKEKIKKEVEVESVTLTKEELKDAIVAGVTKVIDKICKDESDVGLALLMASAMLYSETEKIIFKED